MLKKRHRGIRSSSDSSSSGNRGRPSQKLSSRSLLPNPIVSEQEESKILFEQYKLKFQKYKKYFDLLIQNLQTEIKEELELRNDFTYIQATVKRRITELDIDTLFANNPYLRLFIDIDNLKEVCSNIQQLKITNAIDVEKFFLANILLDFISDIITDTDAQLEFTEIQYYIMKIIHILLNINLHNKFKKAVRTVINLNNIVKEFSNIKTILPTHRPAKRKLAEFISSNSKIDFTNERIKELHTLITKTNITELEKHVNSVRTATPNKSQETIDKLKFIQQIGQIIADKSNSMRLNEEKPYVDVYDITYKLKKLEEDSIHIELKTKSKPTPRFYRLRKSDTGVYINPTLPSGLVDNYDFHLSFIGTTGKSYDDLVDCHITFNFSYPSSSDPTKLHRDTLGRLFLRIPHPYTKDFYSNLTTILTNGISEEKLRQIFTINISSSIIIKKTIQQNTDIMKDFVKILKIIQHFNTTSGGKSKVINNSKTSKKVIKPKTSIKLKEQKTPKEPKTPKII